MSGLGMSLRRSANAVWNASGHHFSTSLQIIHTQFQKLLLACLLRLASWDQWPVLTFANQLLLTTPNNARLQSTINGGEQACYSEAYDNGNPLCLNLCLQCDKCYNAPKLVEVRGWIRHNSGIVCSIARLRELISDVKVNYSVCGDE